MKSPFPISRITLALASVAAVSLSSVSAAQAQGSVKPFVSPMFTNNMVLQRGMADPVWGWTTPGAHVTVTMGEKVADATAGSDGKWVVKIGPFAAGGPYTLTVSGPQSATFANILVGDVWVCSGQSNIEFGIGNIVNPQAEISAANYPNIRLFTVARKIATDPESTVNGQWTVCTPTNLQNVPGSWNGFSAVGYYFGRDLYQKLNIPIGLIHTSWGGTPAEAWTSEPSLNTMADFRPVVAQMDAARAARQSGGYNLIRAVADWYTKNDPGSKANSSWGSPDTDASAWPTMNLPGYWETSGIEGLGAFDGIVWFRKEVDLPADAVGKDLTLHFIADDNDTTWVNGTPVGHTEGYNVNRSYTIPASVLKPGKNTIAIRVLDTGGNGGIYGAADALTLTVPGGTTISLAGPWQYKIGVDLKKATAYPTDMATNNPNAPAVLYNGMIAPVLPFGIKGAIWYQGESNAGRAYQYQTLLPTMIGDWRKHWGEGDFPFYIVQLANFMAPPTQPGDAEWAELREAQSLTATHVKNSGIAVAIDIGDANDIHPKNKEEVGHRLALAALAKTYGEKVEYSGPVYKSMKVENGTIRLHFDHVAGGLVAKDGALTGFAIADDQHHWVWADAKIDGDTIVVSSPKITKPVAVRYAWAANPPCNLYNQAGLPASPFRTDDWQGITAGRK